MLDRDRRLAYTILKDQEDNGSWSNLAVNRAFSREPAQRPGFVRELVYGVLRNILLLDYNIDRFLKKPGIKSSDRILLRMGFYQLSSMGSVSEYGAVNETVKLAAVYSKGRQGMINAVLRNFIREGKVLLVPTDCPEDEAMCIKYSCSLWLCDLLISEYGSEKACEILGESLRPAPLILRVNTLKTDAEAVMSEFPDSRRGSLSKKALIAGSGDITGTESYRAGLISIQGQTSQLAAEILDPKPGEAVLDLCAAPGGKSCAMAELMENRGSITAFELYEKRAALIAKEARRLGLDIINVKTADSSVFLPELSQTADRVLCDVPCSGLGTLSKKPEIKLRDMSCEIEKLPALQRKILENGSRYLKKGGRLVYSTCTVNPDENERLISAFLDDNKDFTAEYERQFFPDRETDGFYICLLRKDN